MKDCISKSNVQNKSQFHNKTFTLQLYRLQQRIYENKLFEKIVWSSRFIESKFDKGGGYQTRAILNEIQYLNFL